MKPRALIETVLRGEALQPVPLTASGAQVRRSEAERELRNRGLCLVDRGPALQKPTHHEVEEERVFSGKAGAVIERVQVRTDSGTLTSVIHHARDRNASWATERMFKSERDYLALIAMFKDLRFESNFGDFANLQEEVGEDVLLRPSLGASPMHQIMHSLMGLEQFAQEWSHRNDQVLDLYHAIAECQRRRIMQAAKSPALAITYGGQINAREIGRERFQAYYLPHLREFADLMHASDKVAGIQLLGDPRPLAEEIAETHVDYVEGFQGVGYSLAEARRAWPDITMWLEVPPAAHLLPEDGLARWVRQQLEMAGSSARLLLSAGPSMPANRSPGNLVTIQGVLLEGQLDAVPVAV